MANDNQNKADAYQPGVDGLESRTTASEGHSERQRVRCGERIQGRRRNGRCSDRCRMRDRRNEQSQRLEEILATIERAVAALRREVEGGHA